MSIEQKIAQLVEESKKLQEQTEVVAEETTEVVAEEQVEEVVAEEASAEDLRIDVSEDVAALINGEELTEEFKTKAATIFEAAVVSRVKAEVAALKEEFDTQLVEQVEQIKEGLVEKVDGYLNYVVEQWMTDNALALENGMKNEIFESFIAGMKGLFEQHYIDVPEEKYDVLGDLQSQLEQVKGKLDETVQQNIALKKTLDESAKSSAIGEFTDGMTDVEAEKFESLAEELVYEDTESFKSKLQTIKENYFGKKPTSTVVASVVTDQPVELKEEVAVSPAMSMYLKALNGNK
jgi:uncharacterized protein CbrC (UPF0167 family)